MTKIKIITGGQTGVDRATLDFALCNDIYCGGWCPRGRVAEDGFIPQYYPLTESYSLEYRVRTEQNVVECDAVLIIVYDELDEGSMRTMELAHTFFKPVFVWKLGVNRNYSQFTAWLENKNIRVLNVAGPRLSNAPGIYEATLDLLDDLLANYKH